MHIPCFGVGTTFTASGFIIFLSVQGEEGVMNAGETSFQRISSSLATRKTCPTGRK